LRTIANADALPLLEGGHEYSRSCDRIGDGGGGGSGAGCAAGGIIRITKPPSLWLGEGSGAYVPENAGYDAPTTAWFQPR
jgi:hypothetical protein